jgi:phage tail-like protein
VSVVLTAARFSLTIDGIELGQFAEAAGLPTGSAPLKKLPGKRNPPTVTLKRGKSSSMELWAWHEAAAEGQALAAKRASLVMYNADGQPVARYHLEHAWPSKLEAGGSKAGAPIEALTLVCDEIGLS